MCFECHSGASCSLSRVAVLHRRLPHADQMTLIQQLPLPRSILILLSLLNTGSLGQTGVPICYFPNHKTANLNNYDNYACSLSSNVSACCAAGSVCLSNGLCQSGTNEVIRGSCTDQTWTSPDCPQYCLGNANARRIAKEWRTADTAYRCEHWRHRPDLLPECNQQCSRLLLRSHE